MVTLTTERNLEVTIMRNFNNTILVPIDLQKGIVTFPGEGSAAWSALDERLQAGKPDFAGAQRNVGAFIGIKQIAAEDHSRKALLLAAGDMISLSSRTRCRMRLPARPTLKHRIRITKDSLGMVNMHE